MKKKIILIIILLAIILAIVAYFFMQKKGGEIQKEYQPQEEITDEQMRQSIISLYYRNKETGELMPEGRLIDVKTLLNDPYKTLIEMLIEEPRNNKLESAIPKETVINKVELKDDILYLDVSKEFIENHQGGEKEENTTIYSIVNTLCELTEVNKIKILIDGEENKEFKDGKVKFDILFTKQN